MKNHKRGLPVRYKNTPEPVQDTDVFLFFYLLIIIVTIIKANTIIVSIANVNKSMYIISNKNASIIAPLPHS